MIVECKNKHKFEVEIDDVNQPTGDEYLCEICIKELGEYNNAIKVVK